jgi:hypothetical protein
MYVSFLYKQEIVQGDSDASFRTIGSAMPASTERYASVIAYESELRTTFAQPSHNLVKRL